MSKRILFLLGSADISGGTYVILQHAAYLHDAGHQVTVALVYMPMESFSQMRSSASCWHPAIKQLRFISMDDAAHEVYDVAIFTWWATLFSYPKIKADCFLYFVQSIESRFYPADDTFLCQLVDRTYELGLPVITEATWIKEYLRKHYHPTVHLVKNGIEKKYYTTDGTQLAEKSTSSLRVLVEGPVEVTHKNVKKTIELCLAANVGEVWLLTSSDIQSYPGVSRVFSRIPIAKVGEIYRSCDVLVKLSYVEGMFGPPLEMFHCGGTAIVYNVTGYEEYIQNHYNAIVLEKGNEQAVIDSLKHLHSDRHLLASLQQGALETAASWMNWQSSSQQFERAMLEVLNSPFGMPALTQRYENLLNEYIRVVVMQHDQKDDMTFTAEPLPDVGFYGMTIPVVGAEANIGLVFGLKYKLIFIKSIQLIGDEKGEQPTVAVQPTGMKLVGKNMYQSMTDVGMLLARYVHPDIKSTKEYQLRIEFRPVLLR